MLVPGRRSIVVDLLVNIIKVENNLIFYIFAVNLYSIDLYQRSNKCRKVIEPSCVKKKRDDKIMFALSLCPRLSGG